jgi:hypothetical protein
VGVYYWPCPQYTPPTSLVTEILLCLNICVGAVKLLDRKDKIRALVFLGAALLAVILLSMGLANLEFVGGMPFRSAEIEEQQGPPPIPAFSEVMITILQIIGALVLLAVPVYLILAVVDKKYRKDLVRNLLIVAGYVLLIRMIRPGAGVEEIEEQNEGPPADFVPDNLPPLDDPLEFLPPETPDYMVLAVIFVLALLISTAAVLFYLRIQRKKKKQFEDIDQLVEEAQEAVDSIRAGEDFKESILRCYYRMSAVLQKERRILRQDSMTPREFELSLSRLGLPAVPVRNLTRLFEDVRYGSLVKGQRDQELAVISLMEIIDYCQNAGAGSGP